MVELPNKAKQKTNIDWMERVEWPQNLIHDKHKTTGMNILLIHIPAYYSCCKTDDKLYDKTASVDIVSQLLMLWFNLKCHIAKTGHVLINMSDS